jgi:hypothetical protein
MPGEKRERGPLGRRLTARPSSLVEMRERRRNGADRRPRITHAVIQRRLHEFFGRRHTNGGFVHILTPSPVRTLGAAMTRLIAHRSTIARPGVFSRLTFLDGRRSLGSILSTLLKYDKSNMKDRTDLLCRAVGRPSDGVPPSATISLSSPPGNSTMYPPRSPTRARSRPGTVPPSLTHRPLRRPLIPRARSSPRQERGNLDSWDSTEDRDPASEPRRSPP